MSLLRYKVLQGVVDVGDIRDIGDIGDRCTYRRIFFT